MTEMPKAATKSSTARSSTAKPPAAKPLPSLSVRIDFDDDSRLGPGKIQLLESIAVCGSISAAGRAMDMSYKRAWDLVDEINGMCGQAAVARDPAQRAPLLAAFTMILRTALPAGTATATAEGAG